MKNPRLLWRPKFKPLPEQCASCPFRKGNDKEFGEVMQRLANSVGMDVKNNVRESRRRVLADAENTGDFMCHGTVYTKDMERRPQSDYRQCPGASAHFIAAGERLVAKLKRKPK